MLRQVNKTWINVFIFAFWVFAPFVPRDELFNVLNGIMMALVIGILISWVPAMLTLVSENWKRWTSGSYLVYGFYIFVAFFSIQLGASIYWRITDDISVFDTLPLAWSRWGTIAGLFVCMMATNVVEGRIPSENWVMAGRWTACGLAIAAVIRVWYFSAV